MENEKDFIESKDSKDLLQEIKDERNREYLQDAKEEYKRLWIQDNKSWLLNDFAKENEEEFEEFCNEAFYNSND